MSADIQKLAVFDDRIVQTAPKYAVEKGALSLTNAPFSAISQSSSQHTYNIYVPSENVFVSRDLEWSSTVFLELKVMLSDTEGGQFPIDEPLFQLGVDGSLAAFPLNSLCATMTATVNDTTVTINSQDVLTEVLRLTDYKPNRLQRTCPTMLDKYLINATSLNAQNDPISGYTNAAHDYAEVPNGAWANVYFTDPQGNVLSGSTAGAYTCQNGLVVNTVDGVPVSTLQEDETVNGTYSVFLKWRTTEKLVLSPFIFSEEFSSDTGLFGINNIQLVMNMRDPNRALRLRNSSVGSSQKAYVGGTYAAGVATWTQPLSYNTQAGAFKDSVINVQFLTPSLSIPLPPKSVVPYMEFPRYITQNQNGSLPGETYTPVQLQTQTITLPQIPDLIIIYVKALSSGSLGALGDPTSPQYGSAYLPIASSVWNDGGRGQAPLSINFDNFSGLLSSHTAEQLYHMSVRNGLEMDWNTWSGLGRVANGATGSTVGTVGSILVLKPGVDITLQEGQAPSLVGNFTFQANISVVNPFPFAIQPQIIVVTANSGFFESIRGSSRIIKGVLSEQDIIAAPLAPAGTSDSLARMIGGKMAKLGTRLGFLKSSSGSHAKKEEAPERHVGAGKKSLAARLM